MGFVRGVTFRGGLFLFVMGAASCSTTATIERRNGSAVNARIVGSDAESVYVESFGGTTPIPRNDITDIDHPGDAAAVVGAALAGYGGISVAVVSPYCKDL